MLQRLRLSPLTAVVTAVRAAEPYWPALCSALFYLHEDDTLVVWRLNRSGRSLKHLIESITALHERGIGFRRLMENLDATTSSGKPVFHSYTIADLCGMFEDSPRDQLQNRCRLRAPPN